MFAFSRAIQSPSSASTSHPIATNRRRSRRAVGLAAAVACAAALLMSAATARAQLTLTVNTLADSNDAAGSCGSGTCSLRDAITQANTDNSGDTILFQSGLTGTITLGSALPAITSTNLTIQGPGANVLTISGAGQYPILWTSGTELEEWIISGLTFANGNASGSQVSNGGAISGFIVSVSNCAFTGNTATGTGGAIYGESTVDQSTFTGNSAHFGGAIGSPVDVTVTDSTFSANTSSGLGGAIGAFTVSATNDTFAGNSASGSGGAIDASDDIAANNDIFSGNSAGSVGGALDGHASGTTTHNSVFWNNQPNDCGGCSSAPSDASSDPLALPLANWGGTTTTFLPQPGSAAICAGNLDLAYTAGVINDERGFPLSTSCVDAGAIQTNYVKVQSAGDSGSGASDCPSGSCTLRDAIAAAGSADGDVYFASGISTVTLNPANGTLQQSGSIPAVNIVGPGAGSLTVNGNGSSGNQLSVFTNGAGQTMALYGLTITGGYAPQGGGVDNSAGTLTVLNGVVTSNWGNEGGGIYNGTNGTMTIAGSAITSNTASSAGGGIYNGGQMTMTDSTVSNNSGVVGGGAGIQNAGTMTITESTVYGNTGGSGGSGAGIDNTGTLIVTGSTIANNSAPAASAGGGGIETSSGTLTLANTIVADNTATVAENIDGSYTDNGGNIIGGNNGNPNYLNGINPGPQITLTALPYTSAGASITTLIPTPGDPAICAGLASNIPAGVTTDQRGKSNENTTYPGYSLSAPCVDAGAVQTNYGIQFTTEPQSSVLEYFPLNSPEPVVGLTESGIAFAASTGTVTMTDTSTYLGGTTSEALSGGSATFGTLAVDLPVIGAPANPPVGGAGSYSNDVLTATLPLDSLVSITAQSGDIQVNPQIPYTLTATVSPGPSPASSGTLTSPSATFSWSGGGGNGPTQFRLDVGTIGNESTDLYYQTTTTNTSVTVPIPSNGVDVFVTLHQFIDGEWVPYHYNSNFIEPGTEQNATLSAPGSNTGTTPPTLLASQTFTWSNGAGPAEYQLVVGTVPAGTGYSNVYNSGVLPSTTTSETVTIPNNGVDIYVTLKQLVNGAWQSTVYTFLEPGTTAPATLTATVSPGPSPSSSGTLTTPATFYWNNGAGPTEYELYLGTEGAGTSNLYNSGVTTATQANNVSIPSGGVTVWATLKQRINGVWQTAGYTFMEPGSEQNATLTTTPPPGAPTIQLTSPSTTFYWNNGNGPAAYLLNVGTTGKGSSDLYKGSTTTNTATLQATVSIPDDGANVYIEFGQLVNDVWQYTYSEMAAPGSPTYAQLSTSPTAPATINLTSPDTTFYFIGGVGPTKYYLWLGTGTTGATQYNVYRGTASTATSVAVTTIPDDGVTIYATLFQLFNGTWTSSSYTLTAPGSPTYATLSAPGSNTGTTPATLLASQQFTWTGGVGPTKYQLLLGTTGAGSSNIYKGGDTTATSVTVTIPSHGATVYATLNELFNGTWTSFNYTYTEP